MFQRITLIGRVGQDPEMRYTPDGTPVTNFSVATTEVMSKKAPNGDRPCPKGWKESYNSKNWEVTTWWRIACWRGLAETVNNFVHKGMLVYIEGIIQGEASNGTMQVRVWKDNNGEARASFELTARMVKFLTRSEAEHLGGANGTKPASSSDSDPLPF